MPTAQSDKTVEQLLEIATTGGALSQKETEVLQRAVDLRLVIPPPGFTPTQMLAPAVPAPTHVVDFERRVRICRENNIRALKDGPLEIVFAPSNKVALTLPELALAERAAADNER